MLQIASDLHIEYLSPHKIDFSDLLTPVAPYLILAGDIGSPFNTNFVAFIKWVSQHFNSVFYIAGNHEYWNPDSFITNPYSVSDINIIIRTICSVYSNVHFLNNDTFLLTINDQNYSIIGTTLWSPISSNSYSICSTLPDYQRIFVNKNKLLSPSISSSWFYHNLQWLTTQLIISQTINSIPIVITHNVPSIDTRTTKYKNSVIDEVFRIDLSSFLNHHNIKVWICGHTHTNFDFVTFNTRLISNQCGYQKSKTYSTGKVITF